MYLSIFSSLFFSLSLSLLFPRSNIKNINGRPLSRKSLLILRHKNAYTLFSYKRTLFFIGGYSGADGVNVRHSSRFSFARLPIHLTASYHDRYSIQVNLCIGQYNGCTKYSIFLLFVLATSQFLIDICTFLRFYA